MIKIKMSLSHKGPQGDNFLGLSKSVQLVTQHTRSALSQAQCPTTSFQDHILLKVGLTKKLLSISKELPQPCTCCNQPEKLDSSCTNTLSCWSFSVKRPLAKTANTRYQTPFVRSLGWRGYDHFTDPGPLLTYLSRSPEENGYISVLPSLSTLKKTTALQV